MLGAQTMAFIEVACKLEMRERCLFAFESEVRNPEPNRCIEKYLKFVRNSTKSPTI